MRIQSYSVDMAAISSKTEIYSKEDSIKILTPAKAVQPSESNGVKLELSDAGKKLSKKAGDESKADTEASQELTDDAGSKLNEASALSKTIKLNNSKPFKLSDMDDLRIKLLQAMIERLTGKKFKFAAALGLDDSETSNSDSSSSQRAIDALTNMNGTAHEMAGEATAAKQGSWHLTATTSETYYRNESMAFASNGVVNTADGRAIAFDVSLSMSNEVYQTLSTSVTADITSQFCDPLTVNFNGSAAELTQTKFAFDLDADGKADQVSIATGGSGFLALDKNGDGVINNGSELFGTSSGDGFRDLCAYDEDGNGWIDENDSVYNELRIWSKDENGSDKLVGLGKAGVGAIYLGSVASQYDLRSSTDKISGAIRRSGVFLKENGGAGTIQHVDLTL